MWLQVFFGRSKKLAIEGPVDVSGSTVKIDSSEDLSNYYTLARRARSEGDLDNQYKYYEMILQKDPNSWEAYLYYRVSKLFYSRLPDFRSIQSAMITVYGLIHDTINDRQKKIANTEANKQFVSRYATKVQRYEPTYQSPLAQKKDQAVCLVNCLGNHEDGYGAKR